MNLNGLSISAHWWRCLYSPTSLLSTVNPNKGIHKGILSENGIIRSFSQYLFFDVTSHHSTGVCTGEDGGLFPMT